MRGFSSTLLLLSIICSSLMFTDALDSTITTTQFMKDGEHFFSPGNSTYRYVGLWFSKIVTTRTVVWVANREAPLNSTSGVLKVIEPGILVLVNGTNDIIWSTNTSRSARNPVAQLLDTGNLVVKDANDDDPENFLWQGFDYPSDTLLPGMKCGKNFVTGITTFMSSWKSAEDPSPGDYSVHCTVTGYPQTILLNGSTLVFRSVPWNGLRFGGSPNLAPHILYRAEMVFSKDEVYYSFHLQNHSFISRFVINPNGQAQRWLWLNQSHDWVIDLLGNIDNCDKYALCGAYGTCNIDISPICDCLNKFVPRNKAEWDSSDWTGGCVRQTPLDCKKGDVFLKYERPKLPDTSDSWFNTSMSLEECGTILCTATSGR